MGVSRDSPNFMGYPLISHERVKSQTSNSADTFTGPFRAKAIKKFREKGPWAYPGIPQFCGVPPIISGTGKATDVKFGRYIYRVHPIKSPLKISRKGTVGVSRDSPIFGVTPIISGRNKATDFKFGRYIYRVHPSKSPLKFFQKRDHGRIQGLPNFPRNG